LGVSLFKGDSQKVLRLTPVAMVTKICKFPHKNSYNSSCIRHITEISAPVWGYSESAHSKASDVFPQTDTVAMVTKNHEFRHKIGYNSPYIRDVTHILALSWGFWKSAFLKVTVEKLLKPTPVAMVTKICKFQHRNSYNSGCVTDVTQIPAPIWGH